MSDLPAFRRLQRLWVAFLVVVIGILAMLPVLDPAPSDLPVALPATLAAAGGVAAFVAIVAIELTFAAARPTDDLRALREYEARVTLGLAIAQAPAVLGFALTFVFGGLLPAAVGGVAALASLVRARPSPARLARLERSWQTAGHDVSALRAARAADGPHAEAPAPPETDDRPRGDILDPEDEEPPG